MANKNLQQAKKNKNDEFYSEEEYAKNVYATNLKCNISLSYSPIAKIGVI